MNGQWRALIKGNEFPGLDTAVDSATDFLKDAVRGAGLVERGAADGRHEEPLSPAAQLLAAGLVPGRTVLWLPADLADGVVFSVTLGDEEVRLYTRHQGGRANACLYVNCLLIIATASGDVVWLRIKDMNKAFHIQRIQRAAALAAPHAERPLGGRGGGATSGGDDGDDAACRPRGDSHRSKRSRRG